MIPTMGYLANPTDIAGEVVRVQGSLPDWHWQMDDDNDPPTLIYGINPLSLENPNDSYDFWRTK